MIFPYIFIVIILYRTINLLVFFLVSIAIMEEQSCKNRKRPIDEISEADNVKDAVATLSEFSVSKTAGVQLPDSAAGNYYFFVCSDFAVPDVLKSAINPTFVAVYEHLIELCPLGLKVHIVGPLWHFICAHCNANIVNCNLQILRYIHKSYFRSEMSSTKDGRELLLEVEIVMKAAIIFYLSLQPSHAPDMALTTADLLTQYPNFVTESLDHVELYLLLTYWKYMRVAISLIPSRSNKKLLTGICALLEGAGRKYIFGSGQKQATTHRVIVYDQESKLRRKQRIAEGDEHRKSEESASDDGNTTNNNANTNGDEEDACVPQDLPLGKQHYKCGCGAAVKYKGYARHANSLRHKSFLLHQSSATSSLTLFPSNQLLYTSSCVTASAIMTKY